MKVYGPYRRKDGRSHVVIRDSGKTTSKSYPKYLMEQQLGRELMADEHVDHINDDFTDDRIENLQILTPKENNAKARKFHDSEEKILEYVCPVCYKSFGQLERVVRRNQEVLGYSGPYCSKECAGQSSH